MLAVTRRGYAGPADLRAMQSLAQRIWSKSSSLHVGDLAWQRFQHAGREAEWPTVLWEAGGEVVAWGWVSLPGELALLVDPARPELASEVLAWFEDTASATELAVAVLDAEKHVVAALERCGYALRESSVFQSYMSRLLVDLPEPVVPAGFTLRPSGPDDLDRRVAVHRAVWHPSRVTGPSYRAVMAAWPYRTELDWEPELLDAAAQRLARWQQAIALTAAPPFDGAAAAATGHLARDLDTGSAIDVLDAWCEQALAGDGPADPAAPGAFTGYLSGVLGLPLRETGRAA